MRNPCKTLAISLFSALVLALPLLAWSQTYTVGIEPSFPPWAYVKDGQYEGIAPDAVRAMAKQQGFDIKFMSLPFSSLIPALQTGKIDILATGLTVTKKRAKVIDFTIPWWTYHQDVLIKKGSDKNLVTALCCGSVVGAQGGSTGAAWLKKNLVDNGVDITIRTYPGAPVAIKDISVGRIAAYFVDSDTGSKVLEQVGDKIELAGTIQVYPPQIYALGIKQGNKNLLALLNSAMIKLYKSGKWAKIIHKYMPAAQVVKIPAPMDIDIPEYQKPIPGLAKQ